jgi:Pyridoxal-dependent decarboxylase, C-terminal sheet domain
METQQTVNQWRYPLWSSRPDHAAADQVPFTVTGPSCDSSDTTFFGVYLPATLDAGDRLYIGSAGAYTLSYASHFNGFPRPRRCSSGGHDPAAPPDRDGAGRLVRAVARLDGVQPVRGGPPRGVTAGLATAAALRAFGSAAAVAMAPRVIGEAGIGWLGGALAAALAALAVLRLARRWSRSAADRVVGVATARDL